MAYRSVPWFVVFLYFICYTIQQDDDYRDMAFQKHVGWKLNLPNQMQQKTRKVRDEMHCAFACVQETWCLSVNFETTSLLPAERVHRCEILSSDRYTSKMDLQPDDQFIHLNIKNLCVAEPCLNGGVCSLQEGRTNYTCQCAGDYSGQNCEIAGCKKTTEGKCCVFPFIYLGKNYTHCTVTNWGATPWCSYDAVYIGRYGNCV